MKINAIYYMLKYLWILILLPKYLQLFVLGLLSIMILLKDKKIYLDTFVKLNFSYIAIYIFSFLMNITQGEIPLERIYATLNNILIWIIAILFYSTIRFNGPNFKKIAQYNYRNINVLLFTGFVSIVSYYVFNKTQSISILGNTLYESDWLSGTKMLRLVSCLDYPNLIPLLSMLLFPWALMHYEYSKKRKIFCFIYLIPIILSLSRSGWLCFGACAIIYIYYYIKDNCSKKIYYCYIFLLCILILVGFLYIMANSESVVLMLDKFINSRESSNETRFGLYEKAVSVTWQESPLYGLAIKSVMEGSNYLVGSHSTYIGFFYKTGVVGIIIMLCLLTFIIKLIIYGLKMHDYRLLSIFLIGLIINFSVEDCDGANWLLILFFINLACLKSFKIKQEINPKNTEVKV